MKNIAIAILCITLSASCEKKAEEKSTAIDEIITDHPTKEIKAPEEHCYLKVSGKDSIKVNFTRSGDSIKGIYHNLHYGIDKRLSTFKGILKNNQAVTISRYSAEGADYTEELQFTIKGDNLHLKYGSTEQGEDGVWKYKAGEPVSEHVLSVTGCK